VWAAQETGRFEIADLDVCRSFDIYDKNASADGTPFGRYGYLVKLSMQAGGRPDDVGVRSLRIETTVQQNQFALPQLWPGENNVEVAGTFSEGTGVKVAYAWEDARGSDRRSEVWVGSPPFRYRISAAGEQWEDVRCRSLTVEAMPGEARNEVLVREDPSEGETRLDPGDVYPVSAVVGRKAPPRLGNAGGYLRDLQGRKRIGALAGLMVLRSPDTFDAVERIAFQSKRFPQKDLALQALYLIDPDRAVPVYLDILEKDPRMQFKTDPGNEFVELGHWYNVSALIGHILAEAGVEQAVPRLAAVLENIVRNGDEAWEPHASIIRSLGRLGDPSAAPSIRPFLDRNVDVAARAVQALGRLGDEASVPAIRALLRSADYAVLKEQAAVALGRLGDREALPEIRAMLESPDENLRAAAARALGSLQDEGSLERLKEARTREPFPWVRRIMEQAVQ
jgi:HEAT repeat protein